MRKEIIGILLFFLVIFSLISLLSYHEQDQSIHSAGATTVNNLFGAVGAQTAGLLVGLFGLGAFWVPVLLLLASIHFFSHSSRMTIYHIAGGGLLLLLTTGCLLAFKQSHYALFGHKFSAGGIIGMPLQALLVKYTNVTGGLIIAGLAWLIGFILATGFSLVAFYRRCHRVLAFGVERFSTFAQKRRERRDKARRRSARGKAPADGAARQIEIKAPAMTEQPKRRPSPPKQKLFDFMQEGTPFQLPALDFLEDPDGRPVSVNEENLRMQSKLLEKKLEDFGVQGQVVAVLPGPVITTFEYAPAPGVKINKIVNLTDDLALALRAISIRIVAPIPGKAAIGIEVPNADRETVRFKEIVGAEVFEQSKSKLTLCLGKDIVGHPVVAAMDKMPHLLIAGATGAGKSVALNTMICSILYKASPDEVKMIMVDPKRIELSAYDGIPHLIAPVVTDAKKATNALFWAVKEMERRYELLSEHKARNIAQYNQKLERAPRKAKPPPAAEAGGEGSGEEAEAPRPLPYIVIIIDELADLMMVASRDVEVALTRLAQMARAAGIHLILATQRPSVDVLTGIIKANFPTRLTFQVSSKTDSRTIIDTNGAENLLGMGDMLFLPPGTGRLQRIHGAYISETELARIIDFLKQQQTPDYDQNVVAAPVEEKSENGDKEYDERYDDAVALVARSGQASISMIQRHLRIGYNRAARIVETMEQEGVVGPSDGVKPREVLVRNYDDPTN
ncbi:DNA translocase FtsK [Desulfatitalea alkaliphila]|uniref:DNA translocase FtsK n=1 Tax=Desulfatitalea alkaliphila TaxID=2929485 RepID=A0AA41R853_9BACT|nr:DNA translocase FtsK [Desulfatitalea alkaliphila]MCJ8502765.1 DNA translocase FtsK [Desulfatitalea alkaliphila]